MKLGSMIGSKGRQALIGLKNYVPQRRLHTPTPLGRIRKSLPSYFAVLNRSCPSPVIDGELVVTRGWILGCYLPAYAEGRRLFGPRVNQITAHVVKLVFPPVGVDTPWFELERRVRLATAVLLRQDGFDVEMPETPAYPDSDEEVSPSWARALKVGWP